ncbi:MAG: 3-oxoacyl-[acyl-carrier-protein] synthase III C-terminal domain-containing protein, partial [Anaerolineae bacterium]
GARYPEHAGRFTGEPAYFRHMEASARGLLGALAYAPGDFDHVVFHQPNVRFPVKAARDLGFSRTQFTVGLLAERVGNAYAGSSMLGLSAILDVACVGERILQASFGSGAGSDAFVWRVTDRIDERRCAAPSTADYLARRKVIDYAMYSRYRGNLQD